MSFCKVQILGRLGQDPEVRFTSTGEKVASFDLAVSEYAGKDSEGNRQEKTSWHKVVCWKKQADVAERSLSKGTLVLIDGRLNKRSWESDGVKKYATDIVAGTIHLIERKKEDEEFPGNYGESYDGNEGEDIPF